MPGRVPKELEKQMLTFIKEDPPYGPERTGAERTSVGGSVGHTGIYNILEKKGLTTAKARLEWVGKVSGEITTQDERTRDKEKAKKNHVEANYAGQLIGQDTFYIGCLKGIGRIYHQVAGDCFSSFGAANVHDDKPTKVSPDVVENHLAKKVAPVKIERILTDCGTESTTWHEEARPTHEVEKTCNRRGIKHTTTKVKHPWTNGYRERFNKTLVDEFYTVAFRKKRYERIEQLQIDLDNVMDYSNYRRMHLGYKLKQNGFRKPAEAHFAKNVALNKKSASVKVLELIRGEKGVQENLPLAYDSVETENKKKEVPECQLVTTS